MAVREANGKMVVNRTGGGMPVSVSFNAKQQISQFADAFEFIRMEYSKRYGRSVVETVVRGMWGGGA